MHDGSISFVLSGIILKFGCRDNSRITLYVKLAFEQKKAAITIAAFIFISLNPVKIILLLQLH